MKMHHVLKINRPCYLPEEGFILGNGDLSASCFQKPGKIVFQLGKSDFWDLRHDLSKNPRPAHITELTGAIEAGLQVDGVTNEVSGCDLQTKRIREITRTMPSQKRNAPMPKPAAMLYIHYPADWQDCQWQQLLDIESGVLTVSCTHFDGAKLTVTAFIHPEKNLLSLRWQMENLSPEKIYGGNFFGLPDFALVYATIFREDELTGSQWEKRELLEHGNHYFYCSDPYNPLPPAGTDNGILYQTIPDGKTLYVKLDGNGKKITTENFLRIMPENDALSGFFTAGVSTASAHEAEMIAGSSDWEKDLAATTISAAAFWQKSSVYFEDDLLETCWYAAMHIKRSILRKGLTPPGLFIPSTLQPYSLWKGDYHLNYNFQSIFLGDYESNHPDTGDACFDALKYFIPLGEKISRDYYGIDGGCFIQLCGYPLHARDDYMGYLPLGRMAYMTGWVAAYFFRRWKLTMDTAFLREQAYPALKKFARFYAGFLRPDVHGIYHAFPSNQGECVFSKDGATDQKQVLMHAYFALNAAAAAAGELNIDSREAELWQHIAAHLPMENLSDYPEFTAFDGIMDDPDTLPDFLTPGNRFHDWYMGQMPYKFAIRLHRNIWKKDLWHEQLLTFIRKWMLPNGLLRAMSACTHGYRGGWTESLGIAGALTDMLMTSRADGLIRLFPGIPENKSAEFTTLRAAGAFLLSAAKDKNSVTKISVFSEKGGVCKIVSPWSKTFLKEKNITLSGDILEFGTLPGETVTLIPA